MEDLTDSPEMKANSIRSKLLLSIYGDCIKLNKVCKLKINSIPLDELTSRYESPEIIITNPLEVGKADRFEYKCTSRHSSNKSLNSSQIASPSVEDKDTCTFISFLEKRKKVFSEEKLNHNNTTVISNNKSELLSRQGSINCNENIIINNNNKISKKKKAIIACKLLRKLARSYKKLTIKSAPKKEKIAKEEINNDTVLNSTQFQYKKLNPEDIPKITIRRSVCEPSEQIHPSFISTDPNDLFKGAKKKNTMQKVHTLSSQQLHKILSTHKSKSPHNNSKEKKSSPTINHKETKKKSYKKLLTLTTPSVKKKEFINNKSIFDYTVSTVSSKEEEPMLVRQDTSPMKKNRYKSILIQEESL